MGDPSHRAGADAGAPPWDAVVLVCRECRKRSNGPDAPKPKALAQALRRFVRGERPRPRVLLTSCLGVCPKRATAVARVDGSRDGSRVAAVTTLEGVAQALGG